MAAPSLKPGRGGEGFLSQRLVRALDMDLRRQVGVRNWLLAIVVVGGAQVSGINIMGWDVFFALLALALVSIAIWELVFPRFSVPQALRLEVAMIAVTCIAALILNAVSGGPESPYVFFYAVVIVFIAAFVERAKNRGLLIALACACALAPILYDWEEALALEFIATIGLAVAFWIASAALIALKRSSAVSAEIEARKLAYVDPLTEVGTRRALDEYAMALEDQGTRTAIVRVGALGIDKANRVGGHIAGDTALRRVALAMRRASTEADQVVRIGGTEFVALLPGGDLAAARNWRTRFHERLALANAEAGDGLVVAAGSALAVDGNLAEMLSAAQPLTTPGDPRSATMLVSPRTTADRARHIHEQLGRYSSGQSRPSIESIDAPTTVMLMIPLAIALGLALFATGGASSLLLSGSILYVTYFATFGSRMETLVATTAGFLAVLLAVVFEGPVTDTEQIRTLTILVTIVVLADTVQTNARTMAIAERKAAELSLVDMQTGLGNQTAFDRDLIRLIPHDVAASPSKAQRLEGVPAVIAIDFGAVEHGVHAGDLELIGVGYALRDAVGDDGTLYRIGNDDFAITLRAHHIQHIEDVIAHCERAMGEYASDVGDAAALAKGIRCGGALWEPGMTSADLASAAVRNQPQVGGARGAELAIG